MRRWPKQGTVIQCIWFYFHQVKKELGYGDGSKYQDLLISFGRTLGEFKDISEILGSDIAVFLSYIANSKKRGSNGLPVSPAQSTIKKDQKVIYNALDWFHEQGWIDESVLPERPQRRISTLVKRAQLPVEDVKFLNEAVDFINKQVNRAADSSLEIGRFLLRHFFDDDPEKVHNRSRNKAISLRMLADQPDIALSLSSLFNAVELAIFEKEVSVQSIEQITAGHKLLLFRVKKEERNRYIDRVVNEKLSVRKLKNLLLEDGMLQQTGLAALDDGQRQLVSFGLNQIVSPLDDFLKATLDKFENKLAENADNLPKDAVQTTLDKMLQSKEKLDDLIDKLKKRLG